MALFGSIKHTLTRWARRLLRDNRTFVRGYFEHVYRQEDPYEILHDPMEQEKRSETTAAIAGMRFRKALEIGGGEGLLAERLADHTDRLLMVDLSDRALERARERLGARSNVQTARMDVVAHPLPGSFDLIVCSEVLVYVQLDELDMIRDKILDALEPGGRLLLVHSRSIHDDEVGLEYKDFGARTVHRVFRKQPGVHVETDQNYDMYRITLLRKAGADGAMARV